MNADRRNLILKVVRGRTQDVFARFGSWDTTDATIYTPMSRVWVPKDISPWWFSFTARTNFTLQQPTIAITKNPIVNMSDPTLGLLLWTIDDSDTEGLATGNYVFDMTVTMSDKEPRFFCGGIMPLLDNVTEPVALPG